MGEETFDLTMGRIGWAWSNGWPWKLNGYARLAFHVWVYQDGEIVPFAGVFDSREDDWSEVLDPPNLDLQWFRIRRTADGTLQAFWGLRSEMYHGTYWSPPCTLKAEMDAAGKQILTITWHWEGRHQYVPGGPQGPTEVTLEAIDHTWRGGVWPWSS